MLKKLHQISENSHTTTPYPPPNYNMPSAPNVPPPRPPTTPPSQQPQIPYQQYPQVPYQQYPQVPYQQHPQANPNYYTQNYLQYYGQHPYQVAGGQIHYPYYAQPTNASIQPPQQLLPTRTMQGNIVLDDKQKEVAAKLEDMLKILSSYDIMIVLDDSSSMGWTDSGKKVSRWDESLEAVDLILKLATKYDSDGVDVYLLNHLNEYNFSQNDDYMQIFSKIKPNGGTPLGAKLRSIFNRYLSILPPACNAEREKVKPVNLIVITDGEANDKDILTNTIVDLCRTLISKGYNPEKQVGIQFFQVGNDVGASNYLDKLDNDLKGIYNIPDIVDCTRNSPDSQMSIKQVIMKALLGGISREVDELSF